MGWVLLELGSLHYQQKRYAQARQCYEESGDLVRRAGGRWLEARLLSRWGNLARAEGEPEQALAHYRASAAIFQELGHAHDANRVLGRLGHTLLAQPDVDQAARCFRQCLAGLNGDQESAVAGMALAGMAGVLAARGQPEQAARLAGAVEARLAAARRPLGPDRARDWQRIQAQVRAQLDEPAIAAAWAAGRALPLDDAIALALAAEVG